MDTQRFFNFPLKVYTSEIGSSTLEVIAIGKNIECSHTNTHTIGRKVSYTITTTRTTLRKEIWQKSNQRKIVK